MIFDVTYPVFPGMSVYPGDPEVRFESVLDISTTGAEVHRIILGTHTGTHIDAPRHLIKDGLTIDSIDPGVFVGRAILYSLEGLNKIQSHHVSGLKNSKRIIIKTGHQLKSHGQQAHPHLTADAARYLAAGRVALLGIDAPSVDSPEKDDCHKILLEAGIVIVENLKLDMVQPGEYYLYCLPLLLQGLDGSPARVLLRKKGAQGGDHSNEKDNL